MKKHKELLCAFFMIDFKRKFIRDHTAGSFIFYLGVRITPIQ